METRKPKSKVRPGARFGKLTVLHKGTKRKGHWYWVVACGCGNHKEVSATNLLNRSTQSCGCLPNLGNTRHGYHGTKTYRAWQGMHQRCAGNDPNYGGRGIRVCRRWNSFGNFLADMGDASAGMSIDRIDTNGHYSPSNCRWATSKVQNNNRRNTIYLTVKGRTMEMSKWCEEMKISRSLLWQRLYRLGWPVEKAVLQPAIESFRHGGKKA